MKATVSKTVIAARLSWVQIPPSPPLLSGSRAPRCSELKTGLKGRFSAFWEPPKAGAGGRQGAVSNGAESQKPLPFLKTWRNSRPGAWPETPQRPLRCPDGICRRGLPGELPGGPRNWRHYVESLPGRLGNGRNKIPRVPAVDQIQDIGLGRNADRDRSFQFL